MDFLCQSVRRKCPSCCYKRRLANISRAIAGFAVIKFVAKVVPENFPLLGGGFGPRENNICQTAATASGGMSNVFVSAFPAMYQLNLLNTPKADYWKIVSMTAVAGYFGYFFATPCKPQSRLECRDIL